MTPTATTHHQDLPEHQRQTPPIHLQTAWPLTGGRPRLARSPPPDREQVQKARTAPSPDYLRVQDVDSTPGGSEPVRPGHVLNRGRVAPPLTARLSLRSTASRPRAERPAPPSGRFLPATRGVADPANTAGPRQSPHAGDLRDGIGREYAERPTGADCSPRPRPRCGSSAAGCGSGARRRRASTRC